MSNPVALDRAGMPHLASEAILRIARLDAEKVYRDLTPYRIRLSPEKRNPITEEQANELTLTLNEAAGQTPKSQRLSS